MRATSFKIIKNHLEKQTYLNLALKNIKSKDINKITLRVYGVIENKLYLEYLLYEITRKKDFDLDTKVILMLILYETLFLKTKDYVVISEYQKLTKQISRKSLSYVTYFLHNLLPNDFIKPSFSNQTKNLSIMYSYPQPIIKWLEQQYPNDYLDIIKIRAKKTYVRCVDEACNTNNLEKTQFPDLFIANDNIVKNQDFIDKKLIIQDLGAYLVTKYLDPKQEDVILDLCAAPGNKSMHIYKYCQNITANEINENRFNLMNKNFKDFNYKIKTINADATDYETINKLTNYKKFTKILCDVPCSGSGTFNSKPEKKFLYDNDLEKLNKIQLNILETADKLLEKNGQILYSTCSINKKENEKIISEFLKLHPNYKLIETTNISQVIGKFDYGYTLLPTQYKSDGFFMCLLEKR